MYYHEYDDSVPGQPIHLMKVNFMPPADAAPPQSDPDTLVSVLRPLGVTVFKFSNAPFLHRWFLPPRAARRALSAAPGGAAGERCTELTLRFLDNVPISEGEVLFLSRRRIAERLLLEIYPLSVWTIDLFFVNKKHIFKLVFLE